MKACIIHLNSKNHSSRIGEMCRCGQCPLHDNYDVEALLSCPEQKERHVQLGFKVDAILHAAAKGVGKPPVDGAREGANDIPSDPDWLEEISRRYVGWDGEKPKGSSLLPLTKAALLEESLLRIRLDELPPEFKIPILPTPMPVAKKITRKKLAWPHRPGVDLPLAVFRGQGQTLKGINFIASTSFLYALSGVMKDSFLLQRVEDSIAILHLRKKSHSSFDIGVLVEDLCCPNEQPHSSTFSLSKFQVGDFVLMLSSEVDGYDTDTGASIEIKSRKKTNLKMKVVMQASVNGSSRIAMIKASADEKSLESIQFFSVQEEKKRREEQWSSIGQRTKYLLSYIWDDPLVQGSADAPVVMKFDERKMPMFSPAPPESSVIPADF